MITTIQEGYVKAEIHQGISTIEFFHPQSNSLPGKILSELAKEIHFAGTHDETKVIVLRSAGEKSFCAGASFDELMLISSEAEGLKFFSGFAEVINAIRRCPKFVIARIQGKCVGGGVGLAAAADYAELAIGIGPFVVGPAVERKIVLSAFSALAIDAGMWRNSEWAKKKGLFAEVHPNIADMDESVHRLSNSLAHSSLAAMAELKKIAWHGTDHWDHLLQERAAISGRLILSEFSKQAIAKFKAK